MKPQEDREEKEKVLTRRLNKILETRFENDQDTLEALKELSTFFTDNSLQSRRNLRSQIEKRSLIINENFLSAFREVKNALDDVYNDIASMSETVTDMTKRLENTKAQTKSLIDQTNSYQEESQKMSLQEKIINAFIECFQLSQNELTALYGKTTDAPISSDLFKILDKVQQIQNDCRLLTQLGHQRLAVDIMEQVTLYQEGALERLYRWTQHNCRNVDSPDVMPLVTKAMAHLQDRPVLFKYVLDEYCTARRAVLVGCFIDALTRGGAGNQKPMEHHAHDPQRYVGDMMAWLNQALPIEKENLFILVKLCDKSDISEQLSQALANISQGVCHPLKIRVEKMLSVPVPSTILYAVTNLIRFYKNSISQIVKGGMLDLTLCELEEKSEKIFLGTLHDQVTSALTNVEAPPRDLSPTTSINQMLLLLREILSTTSISEGRDKNVNKITNCILEPLWKSVNEQASPLPSTDMAVYMLNCLYAMQTCISVFEYMDERLERLQAQSDAQIDTLTSEQASYLVANLNLGPIYTILQDQGKSPLSLIPGMEPTNLRNFMTRLDSLAVMPDMVLLPQVSLLTSSKHRSVVQKRAFQVLHAIYKQLFEGVHDPKNQYQNPSSILSRTPEELKKMLDI